MPKSDTQFQRGSPGGPGRPKGSKNKLCEDFLAALAEGFKKHGPDVIEKLFTTTPPAECLRIIAGLVPKELVLEVAQPDQGNWVINAQPEMTSEQWAERYGVTVSEPPEHEKIPVV